MYLIHMAFFCCFSVDFCIKFNFLTKTFNKRNIMSFFDESLQGMDPTVLATSIEQMKQDVLDDVADELYTADEAEFIKAAIENLSEEIKGLKSFDNLKMKQKARIIAFMSFIYDILEDGGDFDDEDFDDEDLEDEDEDDEDDKKGANGKKAKKIETFPE